MGTRGERGFALTTSRALSSRVYDHIRRNLWGITAVFIAIGGTAAALPGKNTVNSGDIKNANVRLSDLAPDSVDSSKVIENTLTGGDIDESSLNLPASPSSLPPSGPAAGDLTGDYPSPQVLESGLAAGGDLGGPLSNAQVSEAGLTTGGDLSGPVSNAQLAPNTVGDAETSDRFRTILIPASQIGFAALAPQMPGFGHVGGAPAILFDGASNESLDLSVQVPADRVPGSTVIANLLFSSGDGQSVAWAVASQSINVLEPVNAAPPAPSLCGASGTVTANTLRFMGCGLSSAGIGNDELLVVRITRDATDPSTVDAALLLVGISYVAEG